MPATRKGERKQGVSGAHERVLSPEEVQELEKKGLLDPAPQGRGRPLDKRLDPEKSASRYVIYWAAGLFECTGSALPKVGTSCAICIPSNLETIARLRRYFGGSEAWQNGYSLWKVYGSRAIAFFAAVRPFLSKERASAIGARLHIDDTRATSE